MELVRFAIHAEDGVRVFGVVALDSHDGSIYATEQAWARPGMTVYGFLWDVLPPMWGYPGWA